MQNQTQTRLRVLYVDDDPTVRRPLARVLRMHFDVDDVGDAASVESAVRARRYDGFITDLEMPDVDGYEMIRRVAAIDPRLGQRAVIVSGAHLTQDEAVELATTGYLFVEKASPIDDIVNAVLLRIQQHP